MSSMPVNGATEQTTTVIIGTGLSGLAVAAELRRRGVHSIVVDGLDILGAGQPANTASLQRCDAADSVSLRERNEILRHLRNYAASHQVDVRNTTRAVQLTMVHAVPGPTAEGTSADGSSAEIDLVTVYRVDDAGLITSMRAYWELDKVRTTTRV